MTSSILNPSSKGRQNPEFLQGLPVLGVSGQPSLQVGSPAEPPSGAQKDSRAELHASEPMTPTPPLAPEILYAWMALSLLTYKTVHYDQSAPSSKILHICTPKCLNKHYPSNPNIKQLSSLFYNSQDLETIQVPRSRWVDKEIMVDTENGLLLNYGQWRNLCSLLQLGQKRRVPC